MNLELLNVLLSIPVADEDYVSRFPNHRIPTESEILEAITSMWDIPRTWYQPPTQYCWVYVESRGARVYTNGRRIRT